MTSSRRLLQKNHDLAIISVVVYIKTWITAPIAVDAPLNYFSVMGRLMVYPQGPTYYNFCFNKQRARDSSFGISLKRLLDLLLLIPEYPATPNVFDCCHLRSFSRLSVRKALTDYLSSETHVFAQEVPNSSAQPTPRNC